MGKIFFDIAVGLCVIAGTGFGAATLYYTAGIYYGWKPAQSSDPPSAGHDQMAPQKGRVGLFAALGIAVLLSSWALFAVSLGWIGAGPNFSDQNLKQIVNQTFRNETVDVDGKEFLECTFENVTFKFEGKRAFRFINVKFVRPSYYRFLTSNPVVTQTASLLNTLENLTGMNIEHQYLPAEPK
jgi:hypothetical protein